MSRQILQSRGFTLIELIVTLGIFTVITSVVLAKYNTYNSNAPFANASEDVVLALRQAQVYGVGVKGCPAGFSCGYGVHFDIATPDKIVIFADTNNDKVFDPAGGDTILETISWKNNITITNLDCGTYSSPVSCAGGILNVTFKRPIPDAVIRDNVAGAGYGIGRIRLSSGSKMSVTTISPAGQISFQ